MILKYKANNYWGARNIENQIRPVLVVRETRCYVWVEVPDWAGGTEKRKEAKKDVYFDSAKEARRHLLAIAQDKYNYGVDGKARCEAAMEKALTWNRELNALSLEDIEAKGKALLEAAGK